VGRRATGERGAHAPRAGVASRRGSMSYDDAVNYLFDNVERLIADAEAA
jgi:hypothetical protein